MGNYNLAASTDGGDECLELTCPRMAHTHTIGSLGCGYSYDEHGGLVESPLTGIINQYGFGK